MGARELQALGRGLLTLGAGAATYFIVDNGLEYLGNGFNWTAGSGYVPYLNNFVHEVSNILDGLSEPAGIVAGLCTAYRVNKG